MEFDFVGRFSRGVGAVIHVRSNPGQERYRRAGITASASLIQRGLTIAISVISVPLTLEYLGAERYGVWLTISSLLLWMALTDFGLTGNALINVLAEANGRDDRRSAQEYVSSAVWALFLVACLFSIIGLLVFSRIPWNGVFHAPSIPQRELSVACGLTFAFFVVSLPFNVQSSIYSGYQDGFLSNLCGILINLSTLAALIVVTRFHGGLPQLVLALSLTRFVMGIANTIYIFAFRYPWLVPIPSAIRWHCVRRLFSLGSRYILNQVGAFGMYQSQPMIITQVLGPSQVMLFVLAQRVMTVPMELVYMSTAPLVPAFGEARARRDWSWIRRAHKKLTLTSVLIGLPLIVILALSAQTLIRVWAGPEAVPDGSLIIWLALYNAIAVALMTTGQLLMGIERLSELTISAVLCASVNVVLGIALCGWIGINGVAMAIALSKLSVFWPLQVLAVRRVLTSRRVDTPIPTTTEGLA
jgi:O-antigen/teichoic acid export membrane protein